MPLLRMYVDIDVPEVNTRQARTVTQMVIDYVGVVAAPSLWPNVKPKEFDAQGGRHVHNAQNDRCPHCLEMSRDGKPQN